MLVVVVSIGVIRSCLARQVASRAVVSVVLQRVETVRPILRLGARQSVQCIISERLRLRVIPRHVQPVLDRQHVAVRIIGVRQILQIRCALMADDIG